MGELDPDRQKNLQKKVALQAIKLIKERRIGKLKWRMCVFGQP